MFLMVNCGFNFVVFQGLLLCIFFLLCFRVYCCVFNVELC